MGKERGVIRYSGQPAACYGCGEYTIEQRKRAAEEERRRRRNRRDDQGGGEGGGGGRTRGVNWAEEPFVTVTHKKKGRKGGGATAATATAAERDSQRRETTAEEEEEEERRNRRKRRNEKKEKTNNNGRSKKIKDKKERGGRTPKGKRRRRRRKTTTAAAANADGTTGREARERDPRERFVVRMRYRGNDEKVLTREFLVGTFLLRQLEMQPKDFLAVIIPWGSREVDVHLSSEATYRKFWVRCREWNHQEPNSVLRYFDLVPLFRGDARVITVSFRGTEIPEEDIDYWLRNHCKVLLPPQKKKDEFGIWNGEYKAIVMLRLKRDEAAEG